jgi:hypothetical protein
MWNNPVTTSGARLDEEQPQILGCIEQLGIYRVRIEAPIVAILALRVMRETLLGGLVFIAITRSAQRSRLLAILWDSLL